MENNYLNIGNATTIINSIILLISGYIFASLGSYLLQFGIDQTLLTQIIGVIVACAFAYLNAKYPNGIFNKNENTITIPVELTNEQKELITNFINEVALSTTTNDIGDGTDEPEC